LVVRRFCVRSYHCGVRLILASASPRRAELLRAAGYTFDVVFSDIDESIRPDESPSTYVRRLAAEKSAAAQRRIADLTVRTAPESNRLDTTSDVMPDVTPADAVILGADTTVVVDGDILGKPRDGDDEAGMLSRLSGNVHQVMTGVSLRQGSYEVGRVEVTLVTFGALSTDEIAWHVASGEGRDKAGGYAIQGLASRFITRIEGSYSNVVGLPVACVAELLPEIRHRDR
jgi:septum formation protein